MRLLLPLLVLGILVVLLVKSGEQPPPSVVVDAPANEPMNDQAPSSEPERVSVPVPSASEPVEALTEPETDSTEVGSIKGSLFDDKGQRLPYKVITFTHLDQPTYDWRGKRDTTTDDRGDYWLMNVPVGRWRASSAYSGKGDADSSTYLAETDVWKDTVMPLDLFLPGTRVVSGNLKLDRQGAGLTLTLRDFYSGRVVAGGETANLDPTDGGSEYGDAREGPLPPNLLPGYFELGALPPSKYLAVFPTVLDFPDELRKITKDFEVDIDLMANEEVVVPPRTFTWDDFGLNSKWITRVEPEGRK